MTRLVFGINDTRQGRDIDPRGFRGWRHNLDFGATGHVFVDGFTGSNSSGDGSSGSPYRTLNHAISQAVATNVIKARGNFREQVAIDKALTLEAWGTDYWSVAGLERLEGLTQCTSADSAVLGATLGVNGSPVYKTTLAKSALSHTGYFLGLNLHENRAPLNIATDRADMTDIYNENLPARFHLGDSFTVNGSDQILGIVDASVINSTNYTDAQLLAAKVLVLHNPNLVSPADITASDVSTNSITISGLYGLQPVSTIYPDPERYSIVNIAPALTAGSYAVVENGDNLDVYVYPNSASSVATGIEYSARTKCISIGSAVSNVTIRGGRVIGASGSSNGNNEGIGIHRVPGTRGSNILIEDVYVTGMRCADAVGASVPRGVFLQDVDDSIARRISVYESRGQGCNMWGTGTTSGRRNLIELCAFEKLTSDAASSFWQREYVFAHSYMTRVAYAAHASKSKVYGTGGAENNDNICFWGLEFGPQCGGSLVFQRASNPIFGFIFALPFWEPAGIDGRAILDSNVTVGAAGPVSPSKGYVINCVVPPIPGFNYTGYVINVNRPLAAANGMSYTIANNIAHGMAAANDFEEPVDLHTNNIHTRVTTFETAADITATGNVVNTDLSQIYADYLNEDYSHPAGSPVRTMIGTDLSADIATFMTTYPQFSGFGRDMLNQPISWATPFVGVDATIRS